MAKGKKMSAEMKSFLKKYGRFPRKGELGKKRSSSKPSKAKAKTTKRGGGSTAKGKKAKTQRKVRVGLLMAGLGVWAVGRGLNYTADATAAGLTVGTRLTRVGTNLISAVTREGPVVVPIVIGGIVAKKMVGDPAIVNSNRVRVSLIGG